MASLLKPDSEASLAETVREHFARRKPVRIVGGGTRPVGNPVDVTETLSTGRLSGITLYEPGALTLVAEAGTTLETITDALAEEGQHLPFEPADYCGYERKVDHWRRGCRRGLRPSPCSGGCCA